MSNNICAELFAFLQCITVAYMGVSRPSLLILIESTDSMIMTVLHYDSATIFVVLL